MNWRQRARTRIGRRGTRGRDWLKLAGLGTGLVVAFGLLGLVASVEVSSTPKFCGSCHIMQPYYESWVESSHSNIACVECHIPPGITAEFRKKYEALSMVARYFTGTYSTNPWTEIDDSACLRCHERRLIQGREVFHSAVFDHRPHLTEMRRGMKLRCTSCHSQIVQGQHIAVTTSTCVLCHFKGETIGTGTASCNTCHDTPDRVVNAGNLEFHHGDVERFGMNCIWCHEGVAEGTGGVPRERCSTCHNQPSRLREYENVELLHRYHVTDHKVDCMDCHLEIQHNAQPDVVTRDSDCRSCHTRGGHSAQNDLYAGIGARGVEPMPSAMYEAGVRCEGCHSEENATQPASVRETGMAHVARADAVSCMACHGPRYYSIYQAWKDAVDARLDAFAKQMTATEKALGDRGGGAWNDALWNLALVQQGRGIHNVAYAYAVLDKAHEQMNVTRDDAGLPFLERPWTGLAGGSQACATCHAGIENQQGTFEGIPFAHRRHLENAGLECQTCHRPHEERTSLEIVRFGREGCASCHHQEVKADCLTCHSGIRGREFEVDLGSFSHAFHLDDMELGCADCHDDEGSGVYTLNRDTCTGCHE